MAATREEPTDQMMFHRASGAEKLHGIFIFVGNRAHLVQEFLLAVLLLTAAPAFGWEHWGGDRGGTRFSPLAQITPAHVGSLVRAREFRTGDLDTKPPAAMARTKIEIEKPVLWPGEFQITSGPVVSRGVVIVGSSISDNVRVDAPLGTVRAFDARSGRPRWTWDPLVHNGIVAGHANVWAPMSVDEARGLVFLPTTSPSPDFWGGKRPGNDEHANSVVALRAETGELVWSFQTVHHDVWDYDVPAQPTLTRIDTGAGLRDVVIQPTKQGFVFVLDRDTGKPIWPVEERPVPQGGAEGEQLSPTQPFPTHVPALMSQQFSTADIFRLPPTFGRSACEEKLEGLRNDGLYTPPSTQGTLEFPFTGGGVNWGGAAFDPVNQILYANTSYAVHAIKLIPRTEAEDFKPPPGYELGLQRGAPFAMTREVSLSPLGLPCNKPPWGTLVAVDLTAGEIFWPPLVGPPGGPVPAGVA